MNTNIANELIEAQIYKAQLETTLADVTAKLCVFLCATRDTKPTVIGRVVGKWRNTQLMANTDAIRQDASSHLYIVLEEKLNVPRHIGLLVEQCLKDYYHIPPF